MKSAMQLAKSGPIMQEYEPPQLTGQMTVRFFPCQIAFCHQIQSTVPIFTQNTVYCTIHPDTPAQVCPRKPQSTHNITSTSTCQPYSPCSRASMRSQQNVSPHRSHLLRQQQPVEHFQLITPSHTRPLGPSHPS